MNKIEELKAAYEALAGSELLEDDPVYMTSEELEARARFITFAHSLMPTLLEAVDLLKMAAHAVETPGDFSSEELDEQVWGDIGVFLANLEILK